MTDYGTPGSYGSETSMESSSPSATGQAREVAGSAAQEAGGVASTAKDQTKAVASTAADQTRVIAHDAKDQARRLSEEAKGQVRRQVDDQANRLGRNLGDVGQQLRTMAEKADDPESPVTNMTRQAADGIERFASRLEGGGFDQVLDDVKRFARNRPGVFLLGALGAGFVVGRLFKAVDLGAVAKGDTSMGTADTSVDRAIGGWDQELQVTPVESSAASYDAFATTPGTPGAAEAVGTSTPETTYPASYPGATEYPPESTMPSSVPTYSDPQTTGYPATPPVAPADDEWGRT